MDSAIEEYVCRSFSEPVSARRLPWSYGVEAGIFHCDCLVCWASAVEVRAPRAALAAVRIERRKYLRLLELSQISGKPGLVVARWPEGLGVHVVDGLAAEDRGFSVLLHEWFRKADCRVRK